jgi:hypothetical protein
MLSDLDRKEERQRRRMTEKKKGRGFGIFCCSGRRQKASEASPALSGAWSFHGS